MTSLRSRLLLAASLVLALFIGLCGAALERAFRNAALEAQRDKMQGLIYGLIGAMDSNAGGTPTVLDTNLPDPRLKQPQSGLAAALLDESGIILWSSVDYPRLQVSAPEVGQSFFIREAVTGDFILSFGLRWIDAADDPRRYSLVLVENDDAFGRQLASYRGTLWAVLAFSAGLLLFVLVGVLRWGLRPLRQLVRELRRIEEGGQSGIESRYPKELAPLSGALNAMIGAERNQQTRYRNALGDLAHSLKTPLAVLRGATTDNTVQEQISRMQHIVDYQLRRAAAAGRRCAWKRWPAAAPSASHWRCGRWQTKSALH